MRNPLARVSCVCSSRLMALHLVILGSSILATTSSQSWAFSMKTSSSNFSWAYGQQDDTCEACCRTMLAESTCLEPELELAQPFLLGLSCIFNQVETYMETIRNERLLLVLDQGGVVALQDGLVAYFSYYKPVRYMQW
jgi:hypothetical protein